MSGAEPKIWMWDWSVYLFKAIAWLKRMSYSLKMAWMNEEISIECLRCLCGKSFHTIEEPGSRSGSGYLCDPLRCHCPHGESLVMPEFLFLVQLLPSCWNHWPVRDLSEEINMLISLDLPPQLLPLSLCASQDVAFPGPLGRTMSPGGMSLKHFHN